MILRAWPWRGSWPGSRVIGTVTTPEQTQTAERALVYARQTGNQHAPASAHRHACATGPPVPISSLLWGEYGFDLVMGPDDGGGQWPAKPEGSRP